MRRATWAVLGFVALALVWHAWAPEQCNDADEQGQCGLAEYWEANR